MEGMIEELARLNERTAHDFRSAVRSSVVRLAKWVGQNDSITDGVYRLMPAYYKALMDAIENGPVQNPWRACTLQEWFDGEGLIFRPDHRQISLSGGTQWPHAEAVLAINPSEIFGQASYLTIAQDTHRPFDLHETYVKMLRAWGDPDWTGVGLFF